MCKAYDRDAIQNSSARPLMKLPSCVHIYMLNFFVLRRADKWTGPPLPALHFENFPVHLAPLEKVQMAEQLAHIDPWIPVIVWREA